jgi:hypothetical protein
MKAQQAQRRGFGAAVVMIAVVYIVGAATLLIGLLQWRTSTIAELSNPAERARWQEWKTEAAKQDGRSGPVARRPPKSDEPPTLVLLRDHIGVLIAASLTFYSFLFGLAVFLGRGMLRGSSTG